MFSVKFLPHNKIAQLNSEENILEAASKAGYKLGTLCGGEGLCGKCRMHLIDGQITDKGSWNFSKTEVDSNSFLACCSYPSSDLIINIPDDLIVDKSEIIKLEKENSFTDLNDYGDSPLVFIINLKLKKPELNSVESDQQIILNQLEKKIGFVHFGLDVLKNLSAVIRENNYQINIKIAYINKQYKIIEVINKDIEVENYFICIDIGTTTIIVHLLDIETKKTIDKTACYNSQAVHGADVTSRMIYSEKNNSLKLQEFLVNDINKLIKSICIKNNITLSNINAIVCAGNTAMQHFLYSLPTDNIRREPFVPVTVYPPSIFAKNLGFKASKKCLLYFLPGISSWIGSDITSGILVTQIHKKKELCLLIDIGTNGEIVLGNKDWLVATSASAGPALEGASVKCGMRAETGAIEKVYLLDGKIKYNTIGNVEAKGLCGSGIIDLISILLEKKIINRSGNFIDQDEINKKGHRKAFCLEKNNNIQICEKDIENIITAKAAIFAAIKILLIRLSLTFSDIENIYIAGAFGNYLNVENAINIGLLPPAKTKIQFVGNTSLKGSKLAGLYTDALRELEDISRKTTYYDLLGAVDYVDEFKKAMFLPHTDIDYWRSLND